MAKQRGEAICPLLEEMHGVNAAEPKTAGRFSIVEADVNSLKKGQEHLENFVSKGFETVYGKIDNVARDFKSQISEVIHERSQGLIPQITVLLTIAGIFAGAVYMYMNGQTAVLSQQLTTQSAVTTQQISGIIASVAEIKSGIVGDLKTVNDRLYQSQFDKGQSSQNIIDFRARLKDVDDKQLAAAAALSLRIEERTKAIDEKISLGTAMQQKVNDAAYINKEDYASWRMQHVKENAYAQGLLDAKVDNLIDDTKTVEERQYINTGKISELDWLRTLGQKAKIETSLLGQPDLPK